MTSQAGSRYVALALIALILTSTPLTPLTPFLCTDDHGNAHIDFGTGALMAGAGDIPGNADEGDVTPWDDPHGDSDGHCRDIQLQLFGAYLERSSDSTDRSPDVSATITPLLPLFEVRPTRATGIVPPLLEPKGPPPSLLSLRI